MLRGRKGCLAACRMSAQTPGHRPIANKPDGAGSAGSATLLIDPDPVTGGETFIPGADLQINPHSGRIQGGFFEITVEVIGVGVVAQEDVFAQVTLPEGAHNSGPGDDGCDGKGVDSAEACLGGGP